MLGNWEQFVRDSSGNGVYGDSTDLVDDRTHNAANEVGESSLRHDGSGPPPLSVPFSYDDAGNIKTAQMETTGATANLVNRTYIHDAWNRLVEVVHNNGTSGTTADDFTLARYRYNGLHWRVWKQANMADVPAFASPAQLVQRRAMFYDAAWRLVHQEMDDGVDPASSQGTWTPDRAEQVFWGARYIDDAVGRRQSAAVSAAGGPTPSVTWGDLQHYLTDAQFSVVAVMDTGKTPGFDILERVKYDPYGRGLRCHPGDFNGGGGPPNSQDYNDFLAAYFTPTLMGDVNRTGTVSVQDLFDFIAIWNTAGHAATEGQISSPDAADGHDNTIGYCGYVFNPETGDYTVRFRTYMPSLGWWGERDPAGYADASNTYLYGSGCPTLFLDAFGLLSSDEPLEEIHPYPLYLGGSPNQTCVLVPRGEHRCGKESQHAFIRARLGGGDTDAQRAAWKKLAPEERRSIIRDS